MKLGANVHHVSGSLLTRCSSSWDQRWSSDDHGRLVNLIAREPLIGFEPKLIHIYLLHLGDQTIGFQGQRIKGQGHMCECYNDGGIHCDGVVQRVLVFKLQRRTMTLQVRRRFSQERPSISLSVVGRSQWRAKQQVPPISVSTGKRTTTPCTMTVWSRYVRNTIPSTVILSFMVCINR